MTGLIDLTYLHDGRWYVLDYKSNRLPGYDAAQLAAGDGAQRVRPAGADLHAGPASLAALPPRRRATTTRATSAACATCSAAASTRTPRRPAAACMRWRFDLALVDALDALFAGERGGRGMSLLRRLFRGGTLRALDHALAQSLRASIRKRRTPCSPPPRSPRSPSATATPASIRREPQLPGRRRHRLARAATRGSKPCRVALGRMPRRGDASAADATPLVLENGLLYLRRYREYERRLALAPAAHRRARLPTRGRCAAATARRCSPRCFPKRRRRRRPPGARRRLGPAAHRCCWSPAAPAPARPPPSRACWCCWSRRRCSAARTAPRIALAAPTGRAAERMAESLRDAVQSLRRRPASTPRCCDALPATGQHPASPARHHPRQRRVSVTTPTTRCRSTSWWSTKPRWSTCR